MRGLVTVLAGACLAVCAPAAGATTITVSTTSDVVNATDGNCSLREAVAATSGTVPPGQGPGECPAGSSDRDTVSLPAGTYTLLGTQPTLVFDSSNGPVTIAGAGSGVTTVRQSVSGATSFVGVLGLEDNVIQDLTISFFHGDPSGFYPAAISNFGRLTIQRCVFSSNVGRLDGGAVYNYTQTLTVLDSSFNGNAARLGDAGTGHSGTTGPDGSPGSPGGMATGDVGFDGHNGGAIANRGTLTVERSSFTGNHAGDGGAGGYGYGGNGGNGVNPSSAGGAGGEGVGGIGGTGGYGGAIWSTGLHPVLISDSTFTGNGAGDGGDGGQGTGGNGGTGGSGGIGPGGTGGAGGFGLGGGGGPGGRGGALYISTTDQGGAPVIEGLVISGNSSGHGGAGGISFGGAGGTAGTGAAAGNGGAAGSTTAGTGGRGGTGGGLVDDLRLVEFGPLDPVTPHVTNLTVTGNTTGVGGTGGTPHLQSPGSATNGGSQGATGTATAGNGGNGGPGAGISYDVIRGLHLTVSANSTGGGGSSPGATAGTTGVDAGLHHEGFIDSGETNVTLSSNGQLANSIVASNTPGNCADPKLTAANNVAFPSGTCGTVNGDPKLLPLADNGGPTQTQALDSGSSALDLIAPGSCAATDQRGVLRAQIVGCDAGAYEVTPPTVVTGDATGSTLSGSVTPNDRATSYHFEYGPTASYGASTPNQDAGAGNTAVPVSADLGDLPASTTYHYRLVATSSEGTAAGADRTFTTPAPPASGGGPVVPAETPAPGGGSTNTPSPDTTAPSFLSASLSPAKLRKTSKLKFALSEAAKVTITIESMLPGRRAGSRCVKPNHANAKKRRCDRFVKVASLSLSATAGANQKVIAKRIGRRTLRRGRYRLSLLAVDAAGNKSAVRRLSFQVVR